MFRSKPWRVLVLGAPIFAILGCSGDSALESPSQPSPPLIDLRNLRTCAQVGDALRLELSFIQRCGVAAECGQALQGTSCGCTRNLVARLDADTRRFYEIVDRGRAMSCPETEFGTICDCPAAEGFTCGAERTCGWNYLP